MCSGTRSCRAPAIIAGSEAIDDWVEKATAWAGATARAKATSGVPASSAIR